MAQIEEPAFATRPPALPWPTAALRSLLHKLTICLSFSVSRSKASKRGKKCGWLGVAFVPVKGEGGGLLHKTSRQSCRPASFRQLAQQTANLTGVWRHSLSRAVSSRKKEKKKKCELSAPTPTRSSTQLRQGHSDLRRFLPLLLSRGNNVEWRTSPEIVP